MIQSKQADLSILDQNLFKISVEEISLIKIQQTNHCTARIIVGGLRQAELNRIFLIGWQPHLS